jgi:FlaG/FlaF family flagellin (archaellin)
MKLVKMLAALVMTVAIAFVLTGCNATCSTSPGGNTTCNSQTPDQGSLNHDEEHGFQARMP